MTHDEITEILRPYKDGRGVFIAPEIPVRKLDNARRKSGMPQDEELHALIDCTLFGSAKNALLFGSNALYYHNGSVAKRPGPGILPYSEFRDRSFSKTVVSVGEIRLGNDQFINVAGCALHEKVVVEILTNVKNLAVADSGQEDEHASDSEMETTPAEADDGTKWYCKMEGHEVGPITIDQLKKLASAGTLSVDDEVKQDDGSDWRVAAAIEDLFPKADARDHVLSNSCPDCGAANAATAVFCESCGEALPEKQSHDGPMFGGAAEPFSKGREVDAREEPLVSRVLAELDRSDTAGGSWMHGILVLGMSLVLFSVAGLISFGLVELLLIVVVLMVHESGHYLGMRLFHYQNVRMFFIPFFGAAVSGRKTGISAFKEAIVILLGPLPGIAIGIVLGVVAMQRSDKLLVNASEMFVIINAFNLLPFLPLDGGRLLHLVLFSRQRHIEAVFQLAAGGALAVMGWFLDAWLLAGLGGLMVLTTATSFRISSMAQELRAKTAMDPVPENDGTEDDETTVPREVVVRIIEKLREKAPTSIDAKEIAANVRNIWERMHVKPPGVFTSLSLLGMYGAGLAAPFLAAAFWFNTFIPDWVEFTSKAGGFAVLMPGTPEEREVKEQILLFWSITGHEFNVEKPDKSGAYRVSYADLPKLLKIGLDPDTFLDQVAADYDAAASVKSFSVQSISLQGYPGREIRFEPTVDGRTGSVRIRFYLVNGRIYVVEVQGWKGTFTPENVQKYFHSFRLLDK